MYFRSILSILELYFKQLFDINTFRTGFSTTTVGFVCWKCLMGLTAMLIVRNQKSTMNWTDTKYRFAREIIVNKILNVEETTHAIMKLDKK